MKHKQHFFVLALLAVLVYSVPVHALDVQTNTMVDTKTNMNTTTPPTTSDGRMYKGTTSAATGAKVESSIQGTVTAVSGTTLTLKGDDGILYTVDSKDIQASSKNTLVVGSDITVQGHVNGKDVHALSVTETNAEAQPAVQTQSQTTAEANAKVGFFARVGLFFRSLFGMN